MDSGTLEILEDSLRQLLEAEDARPLSERLIEFGWREQDEADRAHACECLFKLKGRVLSADDALNATLVDFLAEALGDSALRDSTLVLAPTLTADDVAATASKTGWTIDGIATRPPERGPVLFVADGGFVYSKDPGGLETTSIEGFDFDLGLAGVTGAIVESATRRFDGEPAREAWRGAVALARWLLAAELLGVGRFVLEDAVSYTKTRKQYGVAIGTFQALQHRMASAHAALVGASHLVTEAASTGSPWTALIAKAVAGRAAEDACTQAQQAYGALGFTWEQDFHRYLRRSYALDRLFGDYRSLEFEIGRHLQTTREVPRIGGF